MNILVVTQFIPMPDRQADMLRLVEILRMAKSDHTIVVLVTDVLGQQQRFGRDCVSASRARIEYLGIRVLDEREAAHDGADYQVVLFEAYPLAHSRLMRMRLHYPDAVMVVDTVDIGYLRLASQEKARRGSKRLSRKVRTAKRVELRTYESADLVVAISDSESQHIREHLPNAKVEVIPLVIDVIGVRAKAASQGRLIFVGNFDHQANVDAVRWMTEQIFPIVRQSIPDARLTVVGNRAPQDLTGDAPGVEVLGFVPDLATCYAAADISVAPLTWGGGLKGKVAQAMAYGLPVVTTSVGASGFDLEHRRDAMVADSPQEFAAAVVELHVNRALYERIRSEGRALVEARYSPRRVGVAVSKLFLAVQQISPARLSAIQRWRLAVKIAFHRRVGWRFQRTAGRAVK